MNDPIAALLAADAPGVLAIISDVTGPSYRPVGAMMAVLSPTESVGGLSSGCVEADVRLHAMDAITSGRQRTVRYGSGSSFFDIQLPCGGGLEILLVPDPDRNALEEVIRRRAAREPCTLRIDVGSGVINVEDVGVTGKSGECLLVRMEPEIRFLAFGKGPEAIAFCALAHSADYPHLLLSPDEETLTGARSSGCDTHLLTMKGFPEDLTADSWTAIALFFHDHDWEPPILSDALATQAFYIGAQGSSRARDARLIELEAMGIDQQERDRVRGPIGVIPSARDPRTLAVSVLAEIIATAQAAERQ
ncbi:MAG: molybdenum cofactor insertion chaperone PaoD [Hyphomicrobiales bacterium]